MTEPERTAEVSSGRSILHVDMDAFYASVELLRHPELRGRPVVVGGAGSRGVVAAASYEARSYGVHSAMPSVRARRLCPDAVFLDGDHAHYGEVSARLMEIFRSVTPLVEPLSLDEAFLDVTGTRRLLGEPVDVARRLRERVRDEERLSCSLGVATNKFLAKLATNRAKPSASRAGPIEGSGVHVVSPGGELDFLHPLPVGALWGVGPATLAKLERIGIERVGDLAVTPIEALVASLGKGAGAHLHALANGIDDRPVVPDQAPKSISHEETFRRDLHSTDELRSHLVRLSDAVASRLRRHGVRARTIQLKVRFGDFSTVTRSVTLDEPTDHTNVIVEHSAELLGRLPVGQGVRLLGVGGNGLVEGPTQLRLELERPDEWDAANTAVDAIRARFGDGLIRPARLAGGVTGAGANRWGPGEEPGRDAP